MVARWSGLSARRLPRWLADMTESEALRAALAANTEQAQRVADQMQLVTDWLPLVLVVVVAGIGLALGRFAGGAVQL